MGFEKWNDPPEADGFQNFCSFCTIIHVVNKMKKLSLISILILLILLLIIWAVKLENNKSNDVTIEDNQPTLSVTSNLSPTLPSDNTEIARISPSENLCPQISKEFITEVTGLAVKRVSTLNDSSINACDYYLEDDKNAPYIAIIVNKNLNFEKHKQIAIKNKFIVKTDPSILGNHFIAWADGETRISNINLYLNENSFLRIDKNVERAIDNEGMIKLASALSKRL